MMKRFLRGLQQQVPPYEASLERHCHMPTSSSMQFILLTAEVTKVEKTLQDIRSGNLPDFTRPTTTLPDRMRFQSGNLFLPA